MVFEEVKQSTIYAFTLNLSNVFAKGLQKTKDHAVVD